MFSRVSSLVLALFVAVTASAQCPNCKRAQAAKPQVVKAKPVAKALAKAESQGVVAKAVEAKKTARATSKPRKALPLLFNEVCPLTGFATSAKTPTVEHAGYRISLCCNSCVPLFGNLSKKQKDGFVANYTGANRRTAFAAVAKGAAKAGCADCDAKSKECTDCAGKAAPAAAKNVTAKPEGTKAGCCGGAAKAVAAKPDCCSDQAVSAKSGATKAAAKTCDSGCGGGAKAAATKSACCADKKPSATKAPAKKCCGDKAAAKSAKKAAKQPKIH